MIKFFRHIRKSLIHQNKMSKPTSAKATVGRYFTYAIGEIILVVIGILIALQINNWNEKRKDNQKLQSILLKIKDDLTSDLEVANYNLFINKQKDSLTKLIFNKEMSLETFSKIGGSYIPFASVVLDINTSGYEQFQANIDKVPIGYKDLVKVLNSIYIETKSNLDLYNQIMDESVEGRFHTLAETKRWYVDWSRNIPSKQADLYFMTDTLSLNRTSLYLQCLEATADEGFKLKLRAIEAMTLIDSITNNKQDLPESARILLNDATIRNGLVGTYQLKENKDQSQSITDTKLYVSAERESLFLSSDTNPKTPLYWNHRLTFVSQIGFVSFIKTENGEIEMQIQRQSGDMLFVKG